MYIQRSGIEKGQSFYEAWLSGSQLLTLCQQEGNGGGFLAMTEAAAPRVNPTVPTVNTVSELLSGNPNTAEFSEEAAAQLRSIFKAEEWLVQEAPTECATDCALLFDGAEIRYHSDCGTLSTMDYDKLSPTGEASVRYQRTLSEEDRSLVNSILSQYIALSEQQYARPEESIAN